MFAIGEFSKITGLSIKALRLYHEHGLLVPKVVDEDSGYRYYTEKNIERARAIALLRQMLLSLDQIREIFDRGEDDSDAISFLETHRIQIENKIMEMRNVSQSITRLIESEKQAKAVLSESTRRIEEKLLPAVPVAGIRIKGPYNQSGKAFSQLGRTAGRLIAGKPMNLFYDSEYREEDADFESCFPITSLRTLGGIATRELPGGKAVTLLHQGPYGQLGRSYAKVFSYIRERGYSASLPSREIYLKGPGMIFKGNPTRYLTEIQVMVSA